MSTGTAKGGAHLVRCYKVSSENSGRIKDWEEWQANALASATLLPANLISKGNVSVWSRREN